MPTVKTYCEFCYSSCEDISFYDLAHTGEPICNDCNETEYNAKMVADFAGMR